LLLVLVVLPLVAFPEPSRFLFSIAAGSCGAASILMIAYPFAILDHYRIEIGTWRTEQGEKPEDRHKGEPIEKAIVIVAGVLAVSAFVGIVLLWNF
jgi:hypothetical protein